MLQVSNRCVHDFIETIQGLLPQSRIDVNDGLDIVIVKFLSNVYTRNMLCYFVLLYILKHIYHVLHRFNVFCLAALVKGPFQGTEVLNKEAPNCWLGRVRDIYVY